MRPNPGEKSSHVYSPSLEEIRRIKKRRYAGWRDFTKMRSENRGSAFWILADQLASEIVDTHKDKLDNPCVAAVRLTHLGVEPDLGVLFSMDFEVQGDDGKTSPYFAQVLVKPYRNTKPELQLFQKLIYSGKSEKGKKVTLYTNEKPPVLNPKLFDGIDKNTRELICGKNNCRLRTLAFYILLRRIRYQSPWMKFSAARRTAKSLWRDTPEEERVRYMEYAARNQTKTISSRLMPRTRGGKVYNAARVM